MEKIVIAHSEINLSGKYAVAGWNVTKGSWGGVALDGLKVAAAISAEGTLHTAHEGKVTAVVFVDEKASPEQEKALVEMARALAPKHLETVVKVQKRPIAFTRAGLEGTLAVGDVAKIKCTAFCACDRICCNEEKAYPSISGSPCSRQDSAIFLARPCAISTVSTMLRPSATNPGTSGLVAT